jgi:hypothetical protein
MRKLVAAVAAAVMGHICVVAACWAQDKFQRLSGPQIRAKFTGKLFTDEVHWGEIYEPDGRLISEEMRKKRVGIWRIEKDQLCTIFEKDEGANCYEVWMSGRKFQLRTVGSDGMPLEGVLESPQRR